MANKFTTGVEKLGRRLLRGMEKIPTWAMLLFYFLCLYIFMEYGSWFGVALWFLSVIVYVVFRMWLGRGMIKQAQEMVFMLTFGKPSDPEVWGEGEMKALLKERRLFPGMERGKNGDKGQDQERAAGAEGGRGRQTHDGCKSEPLAPNVQGLPPNSAKVCAPPFKEKSASGAGLRAKASSKDVQPLQDSDGRSNTGGQDAR